MNIPIGKIEEPKFFLELAFRRASEKAKRAGESIKGDKLEKERKIELIRLECVKDILSDRIDKIVNAFPRFDELSDFYKELIKCIVDYKEMKRDLSFIVWTKKKIIELHHKYVEMIKKDNDMRKIKKHRFEFYGRVSSLMKKTKKTLSSLELLRREIIDLPVIKNMFTVCITGFPNVGKTTLLSKLTSSTPEIASYPFTTKKLNIGYFNNIQIIDTPGTLNRFNKMNNIEKQAFIAMKYVADLIVYIFDLSEPYPLKEQIKLFEKIKKMNKPIMIYLSKSDIIEADIIENFAMQYSGIHDLEILKKEIINASRA